MADTFGRNIKYGGGFKPEGTTVNFAGLTGTSIVRNINISLLSMAPSGWKTKIIPM